jgi:thermostable 8-oxoguanine DNA glycosylase
MAKRVAGGPPNFRLGQSLAEEVGACLLGGHGIPGEIGVAAFRHLKAQGAFGAAAVDAQTLAGWLHEPLLVAGRTVRYRFANQKAKFLAAALARLQNECPPVHSGRAFRDWLLCIPGVGLKTASWVARNWLQADDVAILDVHLLRVGVAIGLFPAEMSVERHYLELESRFLCFSAALGIKPSELDAVIWHEMARSPNSVRLMRTGSSESRDKFVVRSASTAEKLEHDAVAV